MKSSRSSLRALFAIGLVASALMGAGCSSDESSGNGNGGGGGGTTTPPGTSNNTEDDAKNAEALRKFAGLAHERYGASLEKARLMRDAITAFLAAPSEAGLAAARVAWIDARAPYGETETFRFFDGPIDDENGPEGRVNAWPLDEAYIDYTVGADGSGIVNHPDQYPTITKELLSEANEKDGEANVATGWHAIEFLLWGQDLTNTGPGARPFTDYTTAPNADRRKEYLRVVTDLLVEDLEFVTNGWDDTKDGSYAQGFEKLAGKEGIEKAFRGMVMLSGLELSRERMRNAYEKGDQEEEHSCFSDNTTADLFGNAKGIENAYLRGGMGDLVAAKDAAADADVRQKLAAALDAIKAIPAPFDTAIVNLESRPKVQAAIEAATALSDSIRVAGTKLGVTVDIQE